MIFKVILALTCVLAYAQFATAQIANCNDPALCRFGECETLSTGFKCHCVQGVQGDNCDRLIENGQSICLSYPCWNNGQCQVTSTNSFVCNCQAGFSGTDCRTAGTGSVQPPATFPPVTGNPVVVTVPPPVTNPPPSTPSVVASTQRVLYDKRVNVYAKGGYSLYMECTYYNPTRTIQTGTISSGQTYDFYIPGDVDFEVGEGVRVVGTAIGGIQVFNKRINADPTCIHAWGTTQGPSWTTVDC